MIHSDTFSRPRYVTMALLSLILSCTLQTALCGQAHKWETVNNINSLDYTDIDFADSLHGMATGNWAQRGKPTIRRTTDGGQTWETVLENGIEYDDKGNFLRHPLRFLAISHPTPEIAIAVAEKGLMIRTYDGGQTWDSLDFGFRKFFVDVNMFSASGGVAASADNRVFSTADGGRSWEQIATPDITSLQFIAYADNDNIILKHFNIDRYGSLVQSGIDTQWAMQSAPNRAGEMYFLNPTVGFAVGFDLEVGSVGNDRVWKTVDGGKTWNSLLEKRIAPAFGLVSVNFLDEQHGIAGGMNGKIIRTTDGGNSWIVDDSGIQNTILHAVTKIEYVNRNLAFAVSDNGQVVRYKTTATSVPTRLEIPNRFSVYPNPAVHNLTISLAAPCHDMTIELFDLSGRAIYVKHLSDAGTEHSFPVNNFPAGIYHIRIDGCKYTSSQSVVISP